MISGRIAKEVFELMLQTGQAPGKIVEERGLKQVTDTSAIEKVVDEIIAANPKQVEQVQTKPKTLGWFVGQVMRATGGKANPDAVNAILREKLKVSEEVDRPRVQSDRRRAQPGGCHPGTAPGRRIRDRKSDFRVMAFRACAAYLSTIGPFVAKRLEKFGLAPALQRRGSECPTRSASILWWS